MALLHVLEGIRMPWLDAVMYGITQLGDETFMLIIAMLMFWCINKRRGLYLIYAGFSGLAIYSVLKIALRVPRPWVLDKSLTIVEKARGRAGDYSFPSGHSVNITDEFGVVGVTTRKKGIRIVSIAAIFLVVFSRLYLGVHTPYDVSAGVLLGLVIVLGLKPFFATDERMEKSMKFVLPAVTLIAAAAAVYIFHIDPATVDELPLMEAKKIGMDVLGAVLGADVVFAADRRYIHFRTDGPIAFQIFKLAGGLVLVLLVKTIFKTIFSVVLSAHPWIADLIRYFLIVAAGGALWPSVFTKVGNKFGIYEKQA